MATPDQSPLSPVNKDLLGKVFAHPHNDSLQRLVRVLSTTAGVDATLLFIGYSLTLVGDQLTRLLQVNLEVLAQRIASNASKVLLPGETVVASLPLPTILQRLVRFRDGAKIISGMCSDTRAVMRLWGLLKIWLLARGTYFKPPQDAVLKAIAWTQIASISAYYVYEHGFYLAYKGVYTGWKKEEIGKWFKMSIYTYGAYLALDYVRLWREAHLEQTKPYSEKRKGKAREEADRAWYRALQIDAAYTPLSVHWGTDGGKLSDSWVGFLGAWAGLVSFREAWRQAGS